VEKGGTGSRCAEVLHHDAGATLIPELCGRGRCEENFAMGAPTREANPPSPELLRGGGPP
jgi:hypothetical protein